MVTAGPGAPRRLTILGATGSIGGSVADLVANHPGAFAVEAVTAGRDARKLAAVARRLGARLAVVADPGAYGDLKAALAGSGIEAAAGVAALSEAAVRPAGIVVAAIVGAAGIVPTYAAVTAGRTIVLANKECMVAAGDLFTSAARRHGATLLPADSEHNAIFQALGGRALATVERIGLTASGGPFRTWTRERMAAATPADALAHPRWTMGKKITIDSATLMNKGLEVIEAYHLFGVGSDLIEVVVHPESIIHGWVAWRDGAVTAALARPDMRIPLAHCLWWPETAAIPETPRIGLPALGRFTFEPPDLDRFPALQLARAALFTGGGATNILNAANEVAVGAFLDGRIGFLDIVAVVADVLDKAVATASLESPENLEAVLAIDALGRRLAQARLVAMVGQGQGRAGQSGLETG